MGMLYSSGHSNIRVGRFPNRYFLADLLNPIPIKQPKICLMEGQDQHRMQGSVEEAFAAS